MKPKVTKETMEELSNKMKVDILSPLIKNRMMEMGMDSKKFEKEAGFACQIWNSPKNSYLRKSTKQSFLQAIINIAQTGLTLSPIAKETFLIPRYNGLTKQVECHLEPSYIGLTKLLTDSGSVTSIQTNLVYEGDHFKVNLGIETKIDHQPFYVCGTEKGKIKGVYSVATLHNGQKQFEYMTIDEVNKIRGISESYKAYTKDNNKQSIWVDWYDEMVRKTCLKRIYKYLPRTDQTKQIDHAIELTNQDYMATYDQISYIEQLIATSSLTEDQKEQLEREFNSMNAARAGEMIEFLQRNQLNPITEGTGANQGDIDQQLDLQTDKIEGKELF